MYLNMRTFIGFLIFFLVAHGEVRADTTKAVYEKNIRDGFAATSSFEIVTVDRVPRTEVAFTTDTTVATTTNGAPCAPTRRRAEYKDVVTYRLDPDGGDSRSNRF
jgi:hypothetical protein